MSEKKAVVQDVEEFIRTFVKCLKELREHTACRNSQYRRIKEIKLYVANTDNKAVAYHVD